MKRFLEQHRSRIAGVLSGPDRLLFRGTLASIRHTEGMARFLSSQEVLYKDFAPYAQRLSAAIITRARAIAARAGRPLEYVASPRVSKEDWVREIQERDHITEGLIGVLTCVESCQTYTIRKNRSKQRLEQVLRDSKGTHVYFYWIDREFGLMHLRLQSWLPFPIPVCINGREWLATTAEPRLEKYYWTIRQDEYATDVVFQDAQALGEVYPRLVDHAIRHLDSRDILRFLGRRTNRRFNGEVKSDVRERPEGIRIKHWVEENSIKMYDKQGCILRIETTINNPRRFKVRRAVTRQGQHGVQWAVMRKSVADMRRRMDIARGANERYLDALAVVGEVAPVRQILDPVSKSKIQDGRRYRALRPISQEETRVFAVLLQGEFLLQGFRHKDLRASLFPAGRADPTVPPKNAGRITRLLRLLRAHGLIAKVSGTRYYRVSRKGRRLMSTALNLREYNTSQLVA